MYILCTGQLKTFEIVRCIVTERLESNFHSGKRDIDGISVIVSGLGNCEMYHDFSLPLLLFLCCTIVEILEKYIHTQFIKVILNVVRLFFL